MKYEHRSLHVKTSQKANPNIEQKKPIRQLKHKNIKILLL